MLPIHSISELYLHAQLLYICCIWILKEENPSRKRKFESILGKDLSGFKDLGNHILNCGCFICWKRCLSYSVKKLDPCGWVRNFIFMTRRVTCSTSWVPWRTKHWEIEHRLEKQNMLQIQDLPLNETGQQHKARQGRPAGKLCRIGHI